MRSDRLSPRTQRAGSWRYLLLLFFIPLWTGCSMFSPPPEDNGPKTTGEFLKQDRIPR